MALPVFPAFAYKKMQRRPFRRVEDSGAVKNTFATGRVAQAQRRSSILTTETIVLSYLSTAEKTQFTTFLNGIGWGGQFTYTPPGEQVLRVASIDGGRVRWQPVNANLSLWNAQFKLFYGGGGSNLTE